MNYLRFEKSYRVKNRINYYTSCSNRLTGLKEKHGRKLNIFGWSDITVWRHSVFDSSENKQTTLYENNYCIKTSKLKAVK